MRGSGATDEPTGAMAPFGVGAGSPGQAVTGQDLAGSATGQPATGSGLGGQPGPTAGVTAMPGPMAGSAVGPNPFELPDSAGVYVISVAAQLAGMHPQTLRQYDRLGLVSPDRSPGRGRRYSARDIQQLRQVQQLSQEEGVNLAGVKRIIELENQVEALRLRVAELEAEASDAASAASQREAAVHASYRRDLVPVSQATALVVWRPPARRGRGS